MKTLAESELFNVCGGVGGVQVVPFVYYQEDIDKLGAVTSDSCDLAMPYYSFGTC